MAKRSKTKPTRATPVRISALSKWRTRATELVDAHSDLLSANADYQDTIQKQAAEIDRLEIVREKLNDAIEHRNHVIGRQDQLLKETRERANRTDHALLAVIAYTAGQKVTGGDWYTADYVERIKREAGEASTFHSAPAALHNLAKTHDAERPE